MADLPEERIMAEKWMQKAFKHSKEHPGLFHKQLGIYSGKIPVMFLRKIVATEIGHNCHNPTKTGHKIVKVTRLMKERANALLNADMANR
jgi:hypothetical protein